MARCSNKQVAKILAAKTITNKEKQDLELDRNANQFCETEIGYLKKVHRQYLNIS